MENAKKQGKSLRGKQPRRHRLACCVTNKTTFIGQDTQLQSPHVKHKWRARHRGRSARTPRTTNAAAPGPSRPRCRGLAAEDSLFSSLLLCSSFWVCWVGPFWYIYMYIYMYFFLYFADPRLGDEGRCVPGNTTMGTTAAARERPACDGRAASGCSFVFAHVGQLRVSASFSTPLFSTRTARK